MNFKHWLKTEDSDEENNLKNMLDTQGLILFFKKGKEYYGAGEDSRVVFARLKNPDEDTPKNWADDANFTAINLTKMIQGEPSQHVFGKDDIKKIKVIDRDKVVEELKNVSGKSKKDFGPIKIIRLSQFLPHDRDEAPNFVRADEK